MKSLEPGGRQAIEHLLEWRLDRSKLKDNDCIAY